MDCLRIRADVKASEGQKEADVRLVWIAPEYNYIPIRTVGFHVGYSREIPLVDARLSDWREISPGIWFPFKQECITNYERAAAKGQVVRLTRAEQTVEAVDLNPRYEGAFFRDIPFPKGALVQVVKDGHVVRSYYEGVPSEDDRTISVFVIAGLIALLLFCVLAVVSLRRRNRRSE
jgi:hypothetical protein